MLGKRKFKVHVIESATKETKFPEQQAVSGVFKGLNAIKSLIVADHVKK